MHDKLHANLAVLKTIYLPIYILSYKNYIYQYLLNKT